MGWISKHLGMLKHVGDFRFKSRLDENVSELLTRVGVEEGQVVLDLGCGSGTYAIPGAEMVGPDGAVYALDVNEEALDELEEKAKSSGIENIIRMDVSGESDIDLDGMEFDVVLLIDVLHDIEGREPLLEEVYGSLEEDGISCVYPMHIENEEVEDMTESVGFELVEKIYEDNILIFSKPTG